MITRIKNWVTRYKKPLKITYIIAIILIIVDSVYGIYQKTSLASLERAIRLLNWQKLILAIGLGALAVVPMVIYDFIYTRKTRSRISLSRLLKNSYIINTFANACGSGGFVGATLRVYLFGKASTKMVETIKVVSQIALFTLVGLITNDLLGIILNYRIFFQQPLIIRVVCLLSPLYIFVPFVIPTKKLNLRDHIWLLIGSSLEWFFALGFFVIVGYILGLNFQPSRIYLAVIYAGIVGVISLIPGGAGSFDVAIIFGMHQFGISTGLAITWALIYRICYYIIPFVIGIILLLATVIKRKLQINKI